MTPRQPPVAPPVAELHPHHRDVTGGWLRPAVFGAMDGLVSNLSLVAGVAGGVSATATSESTAVLLTGFAGLVAGACSMALGEFVSVSSQADLARAEIAQERAELARVPDAERAELAAVYRARGVAPELADEVARQLMADPEIAVRVHVREEMGFDVDDLPNPWLAAGSSFAAFAAGAMVPLISFLIGWGALPLAFGLCAVALLGTGGAVARMTARPTWQGALRQLLLGTAAAAVTYGVGHVIGVAVG